MLKSLSRISLLFGASLVVAPLCAQTADGNAAGTGTRILSDPTYLPFRGQLFGDTSYGYSWNHASSTDADGPRASNRSHGSTVAQTFMYGLTDDIALNVSDSYEWVRTSRDPAQSDPSVRHRDGFTDPSFGATWRVLDQLHSKPVDFDLSANYAPDIIRSHSAADGYTGSVARGGDVVTLRAAVGYVMPFATVQGFVQGTHYGRSKTYDINDFVTHESSYWQPAVGIRTQFRTGERISFNVDGTYNFKDHNYSEVDRNGNEYRTSRANTGVVGAAANYHFVPNRVVGSIGYDHTFYGRDNVSYVVGTALPYQTDRSANAVTARLLYTF